VTKRIGKEGREFQGWGRIKGERILRGETLGGGGRGKQKGEGDNGDCEEKRKKEERT
jgi:hypothetical protein